MSSKQGEAVTISYVNCKGGVGKTTSTAVSGEILTSLDNRVLLVDLDPQCNLTSLHHRLDPEKLSVYNIFSDSDNEKYKQREYVLQCIQQTDIYGLDIMPAVPELSSVPIQLALDSLRNTRIILKKALDSIKKDYDYIIIDNSPSNNILTVNAIASSDYVFIPSKPDQFSINGTEQILKMIKHIHDDYLINVEFKGCLLLAAESKTNLHKSITDKYHNVFGNKFFKTYIRKDVKAGEMINDFKPLMQIGPDSNALLDYCNFILESGILRSEEETTRLRNAIN